MIILDANVAIDYHAVDIGILKLYSEGIEPLAIVRDILIKETKRFNEDDCKLNSIDILTPTKCELSKVDDVRGPLSHYDKLCLVLAPERKLSVATNDKKLRNACGEQGIKRL